MGAKGSGGRRLGSGRKRVPAELRVIEGTFRKDRHGSPPKVSGGFPEAPVALSEAERKLWDTFPKPAWIGATDGLAVHAAVSTYATILDIQRAKRETPTAGHPLTMKFSPAADGEMNAEPKINPLIPEEARQWGRLMSILGTLGLTPADRAKMTAPKVDDHVEDKWAGIL